MPESNAPEISTRPLEVSSLLNPAFCAILLRECSHSYFSSNHLPLPYELSFLVLPIVLHKPTREKLPNSTLSIMHSWIQDNPETQIGFSDRVKGLIPFTKEALLFGFSQSIILFRNNGDITHTGRLSKPNWQETSESNQILNKSRFIGRWFAAQTNALQIYAYWGIKP